MNRGDRPQFPEEGPDPATLRDQPIRQTLFVLLWQHPSTVAELAKVLHKNRSALDYALKAMVADRWLVTGPLQDSSAEVTYSAAPGANISLPIGTAGLDRVFAISLLDAWAALAEQKPTMQPVVQTYPLDEAGLVEASQIVLACLEHLQEAVDRSEQRQSQAEPGGSRGTHNMVAVASIAMAEDEGSSPNV